jgi:caspase domain-containing protein
MSCRSIILSTAFCATLMTSGAAFAENRLALVIGNSAYQSAPPLTNPGNDAKAVAELLIGAGFDVVPAADLTQGEMRRTIADFAARVAAKGRDTIAVVYYAGHGVQVGGENFLVPVDAKIKNEAEVALNAVRFDDLMNALEAVPTKARIVILDACRNNPFEEIRKTVGRGLAMVNAPVGSIVAYSTSPGTEAEDGQGTNSPFTAAFIAAARQPGVPVEQTFKNVRLAVHAATAGRQTPWEVLSLTSNVSFVAAGADQPPAPVQAAIKVDPDKTSDKPETRSAYWKKQFRGLSPQQAYDLVVREDNVEAYRQFLVLYPSAPNVARVRVIADRRQEMVAWYTATTANSVAAYRYFLAKYGSSDMAAMAQGLMMRAATRSLLAGTDPAALGLQVATTCNCSAPPTRRADTKPDKKSKTTRSTRRDSAPAEDVVVPASSGPPVGIGIGIGGFGGGGFGGGGLGGGRPGGGPIGQPPSSGGNIRR